MTSTVPLRMRERNNGVEVALHIQPRARRNEMAGIHDGALKLRISAPPVEGAANQAVIDFLSSLLNLPKRNIHIIGGLTSRQKTVRIEGISATQFLARLGSGPNNRGQARPNSIDRSSC